MWFTVAMAWASAPDAERAALTIGTGPVEGLVADGALVAFHADGKAHLLDTDAWEVASGAPCSVRGVAIADEVVYAACADGTVHALVEAYGALVADVDDDAEPIVYDVATESDGVWWHEGTERLYALGWEASPAPGVLSVHVIDPATGEMDAVEGQPVALFYREFVDGVLGGDTLYIAHGGDDLTTYFTKLSTAKPNVLAFGGLSPSDLSPSIRDTAYVVDGNGAIVEYLPSTGQYQLWLGGLDAPRAFAASLDLEDEFGVVARVGAVDVYALAGGSVSGATPIATFAPSQEPSDVLVGDDGYVFAGGETGGLLVWTVNPWIADVSLTPTEAGSGTPLALSFAPDASGHWEVRLGGDRTGTGELLAEGDLDEAGVVDVSLLVDDTWREGENLVWVRHRDALGAWGHALGRVTIDDPPGRLTFGTSNVGFGSGALQVDFEGLPDEDLAYYTIYLTTTPFLAEDWPSGGPAFDGDDAVTAPIVVDAAGGEAVSVRISPLTNGVPYYLAVRATDAGGLEGPMSDVVTGTPRESFSASDLAGEPGGPLCATGPGGAVAAAVAGLVALSRRRRRLLAPGAALLAGLIVAPSAGAADRDRDRDREDRDDRGDMTEAWAQVEFKYGAWSLDDTTGPIASTYDKGLGTGRYDHMILEFGPQFFRFLEIDLGVGLLTEVATLEDASGADGTDETRLTWFPLSLGATGRVHIWDEQWVVPYASIGVDHVIWKESFGATDAKTKRQGALRGNHFAYGINVLLDTFAPARASLLEAQTGINDSYVVVEFRQNRIADRVGGDLDVGEGFDFSGDTFTVGLKLDF